jgi:hypothetical protein
MCFLHTITIFLIEITTNKRFISYNNPLNYSLKYGITGEFGNCGSKVCFIAENSHLIKSNDRESRLIINRKYSGCAVTDFLNFCAMRSSGKFKRSSVASRTGQPGKGGGLVGPVYQERAVKRLRFNSVGA